MTKGTGKTVTVFQQKQRMDKDRENTKNVILWKLHKKRVERKRPLSMTVENDRGFPHKKGIKNVVKSVIHRVIHIIHKKIPKFLHFT